MTETYSLWLVPERGTPAYRRLDDLISDRSRSYPDAPDFDPHVTLLGGIDADEGGVSERTQALVRGCDPFDLDFVDVSCSTTTHQCVFLLMAPSVVLLELRRDASAAFERDERMYVPHLSLVYSDMGPKERIRVVESTDVESLPDGVRIDTVELVDTGGPVAEWRTVSAYAL